MRAIDRYRFEVSIKTASYLMLAIGVNRAKRELFMHFPTGSNFRCESLSDGALQPNACLPDHVSVHSDGASHIKTRERSKTVYRDRKILINHPLNLPRGGWMPVLIRSYFIDGTVPAHDFKATSSTEQPAFDAGDADRFSLVVATKANNVHPVAMMSAPILRRLSLIGPPVLIQEVCHHADSEPRWMVHKPNGTDVVAFICRETLARPESIANVRGELASATSMTMSTPLPEQLNDLQCT